MANETTLTREQVLAELDALASVAHALCVEYLTIQCALGHGDLALSVGPFAPKVNAAAEEALTISKRQMTQLHGLNSVLTFAGRPPQLGRASSIAGAAGASLQLGPLGAPQLARLLEHEREVAAAVDARYARLCSAVSAQGASFNGELVERVQSLLSPCPELRPQLADLEAHLTGVAQTDYLRVTRREPSDDAQRDLLELSDTYYRAIVTTVRIWFAHEDDEIGGELRGRALETMDTLDLVHRLLVKRGLLPAFAL